MFERMEISESIYEGVVTPSFNKRLGQKPNVLESLVIREEHPPFQTIKLQNMGTLANIVNYM